MILVTYNLFGFQGIATRYYDACYPRLPNIKQLHMTHILHVDRIWYANYDDGLVNLRLLIEAFPNLERLVLHVSGYSYLFLVAYYKECHVI